MGSRQMTANQSTADGSGISSAIFSAARALPATVVELDP
jgi:hypothetical protein